MVCPSKDVVSLFPIDGHLFGWFPPMALGGNAELTLVSFCPELMAEITAWLDDDQLDTYLWTIKELMDGYLEALMKGQSGDVARQKVESQIFDENPEALALFSQIELRALDDGLVPKRR